MIFPEKQFNKIYWVICALVFAVVCLRSALVPFSHDEVATFYYYIQSGKFLPFFSHVDANGHFLVSAAGWLSFKFFGSSTLALRLPSVFAFVVLCFGVYKVNSLFNGWLQKVVFSGAFILSFNFISFFSLCRGYGISMAFLVLALYYFFVYIKYTSFRHFLKFVLFIQLALSANLTLVFVCILTTVILVFFQFKKFVFLTIKILILLLMHVGLLVFWIKYAFYLQHNGALYYGEGDSYWQTTFVSLIETVFLKSVIANVIVCTLILLMSLYWCYRIWKEKMNFLFTSNFSIAFVTLAILILAFYLLKLIFKVNYPEDRTGLFFYVFFIFSLAFMINEIKKSFQLYFIVVPAFFIFQWLVSFNLMVHPWRIYETMPHSFFNTLVEEQAKVDYPISVSGHRVREFFYGFLNYNSEIKLSHCTAGEALQMNCDYAIAYKQDKPYYERYYSELATDNYWNFTLIKRRSPLERKLLFKAENKEFNANYEYYNFFEKLDTTFNSVNPLVAEFDFDMEKAPIPFDAWLVLQIDADDPVNNLSVRTPLNLIKYDWNGTKKFRTCIVSGTIPLKIKRIVAYLWNIDKQEIKLKVNSFKISSLQGEGINEISKAKL